MLKRIEYAEFVDTFNRYGRCDNFSYWGLSELWDYLEGMSDRMDREKEYELDVIELCCEFSEGSIEEVLKNYNLKSVEELEEHTIVVGHDEGRVLYVNY